MAAPLAHLPAGDGGARTEEDAGEEQNGARVRAGAVPLGFVRPRSPRGRSMPSDGGE